MCPFLRLSSPTANPSIDFQYRTWFRQARRQGNICLKQPFPDHGFIWIYQEAVKGLLSRLYLANLKAAGFGREGVRAGYKVLSFKIRRLVNSLMDACINDTEVGFWKPVEADPLNLNDTTSPLGGLVPKLLL